MTASSIVLSSTSECAREGASLIAAELVGVMNEFMLSHVVLTFSIAYFGFIAYRFTVRAIYRYDRRAAMKRISEIDKARG